MIAKPKEAIEETYEEVENLLKLLANRFKCCDQCAFEDRMSTANEAFMVAFASYNPNKGTLFSSWVYGKTKRALLERRRNCAKHNHLFCQPVGSQNRVPDNSFWKSVYEHLSEEARNVVLLTCDAPKDVQALFSNKRFRGYRLKMYLAGKGLEFSTLEKLFTEIRLFLKGS